MATTLPIAASACGGDGLASGTLPPMITASTTTTLFVTTTTVQKYYIVKKGAAVNPAMGFWFAPAENPDSVKGIYVDCDTDTILLKVDQIGGAACHEGYKSCFFRQVTPEGLKVVGSRVFDPKEVYKK